MIKRECAVAVLRLIPDGLARRFFGVGWREGAGGEGKKEGVGEEGGGDGEGEVEEGEVEEEKIGGGQEVGGKEEEKMKGAAAREEERMLCEIEDVLDVFGDEYLNRHLGMAVVELVLVRLVPEMGERGVRALVEGRVG